MAANLSRKTLKIGVFTDSYTPYISGVVRSIDILTSELEKLGHKSYIFAPAYANNFRDKNVFRFASIPAPTQREFALPLPFSARLPATVRTLDLDIIHVHTPFLMGSLGASTARRFNLPLVFTHHTLYHNYAHYLPMAKNIASTIIRHWDKGFCNRCDLIIAPSKFVSELIRRSGINTPVDVVPTGLPSDGSAENPQWLRERYNLHPKDKVLLYVGRLGKEKNIGFLIKAQAEIVKKRKDVKLVLVGTGPEEEKLKQYSRQNNLQQFIFFTGRVNHRELQNCYAGADIFVFASLTETQGMVVGEAKNTGLPIVAMYSPCLAEAVFHGKDGFLAHDLNDFVKYLFYLLDNEKISRILGKRGKLNALRFSTESFAANMLKSYYKALRNKLATS